MEYEKELEDIIAEIKSQASKGSSSIETWVSDKANSYVVQKLEELEFLVSISGKGGPDGRSAEILVTIDW